MEKHAAVFGGIGAGAPSGEAPAEFRHQPVVCKPLLRVQPAEELPADANGRRAVHLVHDPEDPVRILPVKIHEPGVERRQIAPVEEPNDLSGHDDLSVAAGRTWFGREGREGRTREAQEGKELSHDCNDRRFLFVLGRSAAGGQIHLIEFLACRLRLPNFAVNREELSANFEP